MKIYILTLIFPNQIKKTLEKAKNVEKVEKTQKKSKALVLKDKRT